ncbi:hypothetical protein ABIB15_001066 [Marisediminicola sp. UYEF4]
MVIISLRAGVERDRNTPGLLESWGESTVIEDDTAVPILEQAALDKLHGWAGIAAESLAPGDRAPRAVVEPLRLVRTGRRIPR